MLRCGLAGNGTAVVPAGRDRTWEALLDPGTLQRLIPGADEVERLNQDHYRAALSFGVGRVRGRYGVELRLADVQPPLSLDLAGTCRGLLGGGRAVARVTLDDLGQRRTRVTWAYEGEVHGPVALAGRTVLRATSTLFVNRFFAALSRHVVDGAALELELGSEGEG